MSEANRKTISDNKLGILGENIFINNKIVTAYYIIESLNYSTLSANGIRSHIDRLESLCTTLAVQRPGVKFSISNINKVLTADDVRSNLVDTVRLWDDTYEEVPEIFSKYITKNNQTFTLLGVQIDTSNMDEVDNMSIKDVFKNYLNLATQTLFSYSKFNVEAEKILNSEESLFNVIKNYGARASRELVFYNYVSSLFPSYEISYDKNSYVESNMEPILGAVKQEVKSHFGGYFEMSNLGVELFGMKAQTTYGSIINILEFPDRINSDNFNLQIENLKVCIKTIPRSKATLVMKRNRADIEFEEESATDASLRSRDKEYLEEHLEMANQALDNIGSGSILCEMNSSILVLANSLDELRSNRQSIISSLADIDIIASPSLSQDLSFVNNFVKSNPVPKEYNHLCDLRFPLSFQIDSGVLVGDSDSKFESPSIGESL